MNETVAQALELMGQGMLGIFVVPVQQVLPDRQALLVALLGRLDRRGK